MAAKNGTNGKTTVPRAPITPADRIAMCRSEVKATVSRLSDLVTAADLGEQTGLDISALNDAASLAKRLYLELGAMTPKPAATAAVAKGAEAQ